MKKFIVATAILLAPALSCVKEADEIKNEKYLSCLSADICGITKAEVDVSTGKVSWEDGDRIAVSNGTDIAEFVYSKATGRFTTDTPITYSEDGFKAAYPSSAVKGKMEGGFRVTLPGSQTYFDGIVKEAPMWAESKTAEFHFINVCTILVIKASSDKKLSAMTFTSNQKAVTGETSLTADGLVVSEDGEREISLAIPSAVQPSEATPFCLTVPSQVYTGGFALKLDFSDGTSLYESTTKDIVLTAGHISAVEAFKQIYFSGGTGTLTNPWKIATVADLEFLSEKSIVSSETFRNEYYEQVCDIDFKGASFTPVGRNLHFLGSYDGKGYRIMNCNISNTGNPAGVFANLGEGGVVRNLILDSSTVTGDVSNVGGIVGYTNAGTVEGCTVTESCTISQSVEKKHQLGGIVGSAINASLIRGCTFGGTISGPCGNVGGICGSIGGTTTVDDCHTLSTASISGGTKAQSGCNIAGTVGYMAGAAGSVTATVTNCTSEAAVTGHWCDNGGIVGRVNNGTVTGCSCTGTVTCDFDDSGYSDASGSETTHSNTGGIVGWVSGGYTKLSDCTSKATISTSCRYVGGVLGFANNGSICNCDYVDGKLTAAMKAGGIAGYLYNYGLRGCHVDNCSITVSDGTGGGIAGYAYACMISDCHYGEGCTLLGGGKGKHNMGGIAGVIYGYAGIVKDCSIAGTVIPACGIVGGAVGLVQYGLVRNTVLKGTARVGSSSTSFNYIGGMVGQIDSNGGYVMDCTVESGARISCPGQGCGGMVGEFDKGEISGCCVNGAALYAQNYYCGGIAGQLKGNATDGTATKVLNCKVLGGEITGATAKGHCGGIVGYVAGSTVIDGCYASIGLSTGSPAGGIVGKVYGNNALVSNCMYYDGTINAGGDNGGVGGIAGLFDASATTYTNTIVNCAAYPSQITYSKGTVSGISPDPEAALTNCCTSVGGASVPGVAEMNSGADNYNASSPLYSIKASGWVEGTNGYPVQEGSPLASSSPAGKKTKVALMGDSISTFTGWTPYPKGNGYPLAKWPDVTTVDQVYWHKLIYERMTDCELDVNSSYSGTCVQNTTTYGYPGRGFLQRYTDLKAPDIIMINGGTNDCHYASRTLPLGTLNFDLPDDQLDTYSLAGAYDMLVRLLKAGFPQARFILIAGDYPARYRPEAVQIIKDIADHYGFLYAAVSFSDLDTYTEDGIHPNAAGHEEMAAQIWSQIKDKM